MILIVAVFLAIVFLWRRLNRQRVVGEDKIEAVRQMFPNHRIEDIRRDLLRTNSVPVTIENIIQGRLVIRSDNPSPVQGRSTAALTKLQKSKPRVEITNPELLERREIMLEECRQRYMAKRGIKPKVD